MANRLRSNVWNYFHKADNDMAVCTVCKQKISYKPMITNLKAHLKRKHISVYSDLSSQSHQSQHDSAQASTSSQEVVPSGPTTCSVITFDSITPTYHVQPPPKRQRTLGSYVMKKVTPEQKKQIDEDLSLIHI